MNKKRLSNYDLLRIVCTIAVVLIHVSSNYKREYVGLIAIGEEVNKFSLLYISFVNMLPRFSVPCFVMLSGAFLLSNDKNDDYVLFYRHSWFKIGIPTVLFSAFYLCYNEFRNILKYCILREKVDLILPLKWLLMGAPEYHMWYLYMLIGLYIATPILVLTRKNWKRKDFDIFVIVIFIISLIGAQNNINKYYWSLSTAVCYIGYFCIGYYIKCKCINRKNNKWGIMLIGLGILSECAMSILQYKHMLLGIGEADEKYNLVTGFNPVIAVASLLIFMGFSCLKVNKDFTKISNVTFLIFLFHAAVLDIAYQIMRNIGIITIYIQIPLLVIFVTFISGGLSIVYININSWVKRKVLK